MTYLFFFLILIPQLSNAQLDCRDTEGKQLPIISEYEMVELLELEDDLQKLESCLDEKVKEECNKSNKETDKCFYCQNIFKTSEKCLGCHKAFCGSHAGHEESSYKRFFCTGCDKIVGKHSLDDLNTSEIADRLNHLLSIYEILSIKSTLLTKEAHLLIKILEDIEKRLDLISAGNNCLGFSGSALGVAGFVCLLIPGAQAFGIPLIISSTVINGTTAVIDLGQAAYKIHDKNIQNSKKMLAIVQVMEKILMQIDELLSQLESKLSQASIHDSETERNLTDLANTLQNPILKKEYISGRQIGKAITKSSSILGNVLYTCSASGSVITGGAGLTGVSAAFSGLGLGYYSYAFLQDLEKIVKKSPSQQAEKLKSMMASIKDLPNINDLKQLIKSRIQT